MPLFHKDTYVDKHGRRHINALEMAELYKNFHDALAETYFDSSANHKICTDAMETIHTLHISKKNGKFLINYAALVREVFSHAHYNVQELLYDEKNSVRTQYWQEISNLYALTMEKADHVWPHACCEKMVIMLQFASLFSLYKDVASEDFIVSLYDDCVDIMNAPVHKHTTAVDTKQMHVIFEEIQLTFRLRNEVHRSASFLSHNRMHKLGPAPTIQLSAESQKSPQSPQGDHSQSRLATKEDLDDFFDRIMEEQEKEEKTKKQRGSSVSFPSQIKQSKDQRSRRSSESFHGIDNTTPMRIIIEPPQAYPERKRGLSSPPPPPLVLNSPPPPPPTAEPPTSVPVTPLETKDTAEKENDFLESITEGKAIIPTLPDLQKALRSLNPVKREKEDEKASIELSSYDYKADFERRLGKKKTTVVFDAPIIPKPNPLDRVSSYRRRGLFNDFQTKRKSRDLGIVPLPETPEKKEQEGDNRVEIGAAALIRLSRESTEDQTTKTVDQSTKRSNPTIELLYEEDIVPLTPRTVERKIIQSVLDGSPFRPLNSSKLEITSDSSNI